MRAGELHDSGLWLLLPYDFQAGRRPELVDIAKWPGAARWLALHREALERRHCVRAWQKRWFDLHDPVVTNLAVEPKILCPDLAREPRFAFDPGGLVPLHSAYYLLPRKGGKIGPRALVAALNTEAIAAELKQRAPTAKSGYRRLQAEVLRELPIPRLTPTQSERLEQDDPELVAEIAERTDHALRRDAA